MMPKTTQKNDSLQPKATQELPEASSKSKDAEPDGIHEITISMKRFVLYGKKLKKKSPTTRNLSLLIVTIVLSFVVFLSLSLLVLVTLKPRITSANRKFRDL